jgi:hypothetical protein
MMSLARSLHLTQASASYNHYRAEPEFQNEEEYSSLQPVENQRHEDEDNVSPRDLEELREYSEYAQFGWDAGRKVSH